MSRTHATSVGPTAIHSRAEREPTPIDADLLMTIRQRLDAGLTAEERSEIATPRV